MCKSVDLGSFIIIMFGRCWCEGWIMLKSGPRTIVFVYLDPLWELWRQLTLTFPAPYMYSSTNPRVAKVRLSQLPKHMPSIWMFCGW